MDWKEVGAVIGIIVAIQGLVVAWVNAGHYTKKEIDKIFRSEVTCNERHKSVNISTIAIKDDVEKIFDKIDELTKLLYRMIGNKE